MAKKHAPTDKKAEHQMISGTPFDPVKNAVPVFLVDEASSTGALTDAELRKAPIEVVISSDNKGSTTGGLTDNELRESPVAVSGPLTNEQLRQTPVIVAGTVALADPVHAVGPLTLTELESIVVNVGGTVDVANVVKVEGPMTEEQFRMFPIDIRGQVEVTNTVEVEGPLTHEQLRSMAMEVVGEVSIVNQVPVTGPLTNDELREVPLSVEGEVNISNFPDLQKIVGQVEITNQPDITHIAGQVEVINQPVFPKAFSIDNLPEPVRTVEVSNLPEVQKVVGPLTNKELRQGPVPVSGAVAITNFPGTSRDKDWSFASIMSAKDPVILHRTSPGETAYLTGLQLQHEGGAAGLPIRVRIHDMLTTLWVMTLPAGSAPLAVDFRTPLVAGEGEHIYVSFDTDAVRVAVNAQGFHTP